MLAYAFRTLSVKDLKKAGSESFNGNAEDLLAEVLIQGIRKQVNRGLGQQYVEVNEATSTIRGKINLSESIRTNSIQKNELMCTYDEFTVNSLQNRILKSTMLYLISTDIALSRKKDLKKLLVYFNDVDPADLYHVDWHFRYDRNSQGYRILMALCKMVVDGMLMEEKGEAKLQRIFDDQLLYHLYERFILEYYRKHYPELAPAASEIDWALDSDERRLLPRMKSDVTLKSKDRILILDAKYYEHPFQTNFGRETVHSANLYQIFTYVKNKAAENPGYKVSGMLLYAENGRKENITYSMSDNLIAVRTLDLNQEFADIRGQLDKVVEDCFLQTVII